MLNVSRYAYPDLRWEKTKTINIGTVFPFGKEESVEQLITITKKGKILFLVWMFPQNMELRRPIKTERI